ncbi:MAG: hypothetical protein ACTSVI_05190 [Promethearchaeota archaeon]
MAKNINDIKNEIQDLVLEKDNKLFIVLYSFLQYIGSILEKIEVIRSIVASDGGTITKEQLIEAGAEDSLIDFLVKLDFLSKEDNGFKFELRNFIKKLEGYLSVDEGTLLNELNDDMETLFKDLILSLPKESTIPAIRRDGLGFNKDLIFNRLRGHVRRYDGGKYKSVLLKWLV